MLGDVDYVYSLLMCEHASTATTLRDCAWWRWYCDRSLWVGRQLGTGTGGSGKPKQLLKVFQEKVFPLTTAVAVGLENISNGASS